ncbi:MAG: hypothetical protein ACLUSP_00470 [Christensenellales bacterium]
MRRSELFAADGAGESESDPTLRREKSRVATNSKNACGCKTLAFCADEDAVCFALDKTETIVVPVAKTLADEGVTDGAAIKFSAKFLPTKT